MREYACQWALTERQTHGGGGEPERSHGAPLEPLAQLGDALGGVGAVPILVDAAQRVTVQAAKKDEGGVSTGADTKANTRGGGAPQLLEHAVLLDAARNDDGGGDAELLVREVDLLGPLRALELVDRKRATVDTAKGDTPSENSAW